MICFYLRTNQTIKTLKKNYTNSWLIPTVIFTIGIMFSCEEHNATVKKDQISNSDQQFQYITNNLGFSPEDVIDKGEYYLVDGDIMFNKTSLVLPRFLWVKV